VALPGTVIILHDNHGATVERVAADRAGEFALHAVELGDYTVEASAPGRLDDHRHVHAGSAATVTVELYCVAPSSVVNIVEEAPEAAPPERVTGSVSSLSHEDIKAQPKGEDRPITEVLATQPGFVGDAFGNLYAR